MSRLGDESIEAFARWQYRFAILGALTFLGVTLASGVLPSRVSAASPMVIVLFNGVIGALIAGAFVGHFGWLLLAQPRFSSDVIRRGIEEVGVWVRWSHRFIGFLDARRRRDQ